MRNIVYLAVSVDNLSLPIAVFDNVKEIADYAETTYKSACCMISRQLVNRKRKCLFIKVDISDLGK